MVYILLTLLTQYINKIRTYNLRSTSEFSTEIHRNIIKRNSELQTLENVRTSLTQGNILMRFYSILKGTGIENVQLYYLHRK
jgi:exonuclease VII large subunit